MFGSVARGDDKPDSDIDVVVEMKGPVDWRIDNDIISTAYKIELETGVIFDPHYRSVDFPPPREPLDDYIEKEGVAV